MSRCQLIGDVTSGLILDLFRRLPAEKQKEYIESLRACLKAGDYRKAERALKSSNARSPKKKHGGNT